MSTTTASVVKVGVVIVPITDQQRAIEFYVDKLGLEKRTDVDMGEGYRWVEVAPAGADTTIAIVLPPPGGEAGTRETGIALHTHDLESYHAELKAKGVEVDEEISRMGDPVPPMFWFRDPDNNKLLVVEVPES